MTLAAVLRNAEGPTDVVSRRSTCSSGRRFGLRFFVFSKQADSWALTSSQKLRRAAGGETYELCRSIKIAPQSPRALSLRSSRAKRDGCDVIRRTGCMCASLEPDTMGWRLKAIVVSLFALVVACAGFEYDGERFLGVAFGEGSGGDAAKHNTTHKHFHLFVQALKNAATCRRRSPAPTSAARARRRRRGTAC